MNWPCTLSTARRSDPRLAELVNNSADSVSQATGVNGKYGVWRAGSRPDDVIIEQICVEIRAEAAQMANRRNATDGESGLLSHRSRIGAL